MLRKLKRDQGSVTIEATISLTAFMFAIVTVLTIVNICMVQARISAAINTTAKELSQYSYLYSLTGFAKSEAELAQSAREETKDIDSIMSDINTVFNEIQNLGNTGQSSMDNISDISAAWDSVVKSGETIEGAGASLENTFKNIASDPKQLMFGIAKLAASETLELGKSRLIAAPLAKILCQKHLVNSENGKADVYLKQLGVIPDAKGSYIDGLDFSKSTIFPYGSNEITVDVSYGVKVIPLLPLNFKFHFHQKAVTHGWLSGEDSYQESQKYKESNTLWVKSTVQERSSLIRHMAIDELLKEGYLKTAGLTDVQLYNPDTNEFVMISSMNPLYSSEGEAVKTLDNLDDEALQLAIEQLCGKMQSTTDGLKEVTTKKEQDGKIEKKKNQCGGAVNKIVLTIPEDGGLKEKMESIIEKSNTRGVVIELVPSYGNGARQTMIHSDQGDSKE